MAEGYFFAEDEKVPRKLSTAFVAIQFSSDAAEDTQMAALARAEVEQSQETGEVV